jgi:hypothetical protein
MSVQISFTVKAYMEIETNLTRRYTQDFAVAMVRFQGAELRSGHSKGTQIKNGQGGFRLASRTLAAVLVALTNIPDFSKKVNMAAKSRIE